MSISKGGTLKFGLLLFFILMNDKPLQTVSTSTTRDGRTFLPMNTTLNSQMCRMCRGLNNMCIVMEDW